MKEWLTSRVTIKTIRLSAWEKLTHCWLSTKIEQKELRYGDKASEGKDVV